MNACFARDWVRDVGQIIFVQEVFDVGAFAFIGHVVKDAIDLSGELLGRCVGQTGSCFSGCDLLNRVLELMQ